jgi:hypothetical protein
MEQKDINKQSKKGEVREREKERERERKRDIKEKMCIKMIRVKIIRTR